MRKVIYFIMVGLISFSMAGCSSNGVSQEEYDRVVSENQVLNNYIKKIDVQRVSPYDVAALKEIIQKLIDSGMPITYYKIYDTGKDPNGERIKDYLLKANFADKNCEPTYSREEPVSGTIELFDSPESAEKRAIMLRDSNSEENKYYNQILFGHFLLRLNSRFSKEYVEKYADALGSKIYSLSTVQNTDTVEWKESDSSVSSNDVETSSTNVETSEPPVASNEENKSFNSISSSNIANETIGKKNALAKAKSYLEYTAFSYTGLIQQLEYEKFSNEEAVYGVDNCGADWNEQAIKKAKSYLEYSSFSYTGMIQQLEYEEFTQEQAVYGADNCDADWNEQAVKKAKSYLESSSFSRDGLISQLEYEGFTNEQAVYGAEANGY